MAGDLAVAFGWVGPAPCRGNGAGEFQVIVGVA